MAPLQDRSPRSGWATAVRRGTAALCGLGCLGVSAQTPAPVFSVGDAWTFERTASDGSGIRTTYTETVKAITERHVGIRVDPAGTRQAYTPAGNRFDTDKQEIPRLRFPMSVGDRWNGEWAWGKKGSNNFGTTKLDYEVLARETVQVAAGSFDAYKIKGSGFVDDRRTPWGVIPDHARHTEFFWYAPRAKRIVKYEGRTVKAVLPSFPETWAAKWELQSYRLATDTD